MMHQQYDSFYEKEDSVLIGCFCSELDHGHMKVTVDNEVGVLPLSLINISFESPILPRWGFWAKLKFCFRFMLNKRARFDTDMQISGQDGLKLAKWLKENINHPNVTEI